ncbi:hypothetical protein EDB83DRAFT_2320332 [Lactarius deliciosus]|nr:hypothetical protein EDB83DRAFT_2320332 [Lactarius deliciosus]
MAVADVVAVLAGCWQWLVVFVQLEVVVVDGHWRCTWLGLVGDSLQPCMKMAITKRAWKRLATVASHTQLQQPQTPRMSCPKHDVNGHPNDDYDTAGRSSNDDDDTPMKVQPQWQQQQTPTEGKLKRQLRRHDRQQQRCSDNTTGDGSDPDAMAGGYGRGLYISAVLYHL